MRVCLLAILTVLLISHAQAQPQLEVPDAETELTATDCAEHALSLMSEPNLAPDRWLDIRKQALCASEDPGTVERVQKALALSYLFGPDSQENGAMAEPLLVAILERNPGDGQSAFFAAMGYQLGLFESEEPKECKYFELAALAGVPRAYWQTGMCYLNGEIGGVNKAAAFGWVEKAAEAGDVMGMISSGVMYATGQGVDKDAEKAADAYGKAAASAQPGSRNQMHAVRALGAMHAIGEIKDADQIYGVALLLIAKEGQDGAAAQVLEQFELVGDLDPNGFIIRGEIASAKVQLGIN